MIKSVLGMLIVLVALLPGCGDDASPTRPRNGELEIAASNFEFAPRDIAIYADEAVQLTLHSAYERHTFTIDGLGVDVEIPAGKDVMTELAVKTLGTYTFYCAVPEHREQGMEGSLKVTRRPTPATSSGSRSSGY